MKRVDMPKTNLRHFVVALSERGETIATVWPYSERGSDDWGMAMRVCGEKSASPFDVEMIDGKLVAGYEIVSVLI